MPAIRHHIPASLPLVALIVFLLLPSASAVLSTTSALPTRIDFDAWLKKHSKSYDSSTTTKSSESQDKSKGEYESRYAIFVQNAQTVQRHNRAFAQGWTHYEMSLEASPFADLTDAEFRSLYLMDGQNCSATTHTSSGRVGEYVNRMQLENQGVNLPSRTQKSVDWRTRGVVTPIKNQAHCGSCWTFSTTGTLESHYCLSRQRQRNEKSGEKLASSNLRGMLEEFHCPSWTGLSEQQLLDCAGDYDNHGCNGGLPSHAFEYIKYSSDGLALENNYPYLANSTDTVCRADNENNDQSQKEKNNRHLSSLTVHVAEVFNITSRDEADLGQAIGAVGPVAVAFQVAEDFRFYKHGVYDGYNATINGTNCQDDALSVNHAVVAVGYGEVPPTSDGKPSVPFYIVRNSWGTSFGMEGYFWMLRGQNLCGISDCASFPIVPIVAE